MNFISALLLLLFLTGCDQLCPPIEPPTKSSLIHLVRTKTVKQLKFEHELYACGTGVQAMYQIEMLALSFDYFKPVEIENGRELLITALDTYVANINDEKKIHSHLGHYPFTPKDIEIRIFIRNLDGSDLPPGRLTSVSSYEGVLRYRIFDPKTNRTTDVYEETYAEAKQKLAASNIDLNSH